MTQYQFFASEDLYKAVYTFNSDPVIIETEDDEIDFREASKDHYFVALGDTGKNGGEGEFPGISTEEADDIMAKLELEFGLGLEYVIYRITDSERGSREIGYVAVPYAIR